MDTPPTPIRFRSEDRVPLEVDELSRRARVSRAFIRICIDLGCPTIAGRLSQAALMEWFFEHWEQFRACAGMPAGPAHREVEPGVQAKLEIGRALLTLLEFSETRSSDHAEKRRIQNVHRMVASALNWR